MQISCKYFAHRPEMRRSLGLFTWFRHVQGQCYNVLSCSLNPTCVQSALDLQFAPIHLWPCHAYALNSLSSAGFPWIQEIFGSVLLIILFPGISRTLSLPVPTKYSTSPAWRRIKPRFVAPHSVRISGRDPYKENSTINGLLERLWSVCGEFWSNLGWRCDEHVQDVMFNLRCSVLGVWKMWF
jgi:hypothetical protein